MSRPTIEQIAHEIAMLNLEKTNLTNVRTQTVKYIEFYEESLKLLKDYESQK